MRRRLASCVLAAGLFLPFVLAAVAPPARPSAQRGVARFDEPDEAVRWYWRKRSPDGVSPLPVEKYFEALEKMQAMPQYSTAAGVALPSRAELARSGAKPLAALGTWSWLGPGNIGGRTRGLVIHPTTPTTMYAGGVAGGVWKTTDGGASWAPLNDFLPNLAVSSLVMDPANPNTIYAGTGEGFFNVDFVQGAGIMKTTDAGATWHQLASTATTDFYYVNKIVVSPVTGRVYAATRTGIFRSSDGGSSWTKVYTSAITTGVTDLAIRTDQPTDVVLAADGSFVKATIYRNTDAAGSGTWSPVYTETNLGRTSFAIAPSNQNIIYALSASIETGNFNGGLLAVFRSTDGGTTWTTQVRNTDPTKLNTLLLTNPIAANYTACGAKIPDKIVTQGWYDNVIAVDPVDPNKVWAGGIDLFRSDDGGANWGIASYWWAAPDPHSTHADQHTIVFHPQYNGGSNQTMYVGNDGGLFRTDNARATTSSDVCGNTPGTITWTSLNNNYGVTQFYYGLPYPNGTTYVGGAQDNGTNRGSDVAGPNAWNSIIGGDGGYVAVDPGNTNTIYGETPHLSLQKSTDGGTTFKSITAGITEASGYFGFVTPFVMDPSNSQRLWIAGHQPWLTTDGGATWAQAGAAFSTQNYPVTTIAVSPQDPNYVLMGRYTGHVRRTTQALTATSTTVWDESLPTSPAQPYMSWVTFDPTNKSVAYATYSTFGVGHVWKSTDGGATWAKIDGSGQTGIPDIPVHCLVVDPGNSSRLYVGTDLGVFVSVNGGSSWSVENSGFANVVTESLAITGNTLFAFTHGRGAYRVSLGSSGGLAANFSFSPASPVAGQSVQFTDTSTGGPTSWAWDFGDGFGSTAQSPTHAFATAGAFPVALTVSNGGGPSTATKTVTVAAAGATSCVEDATTMCLVGGRYRIRSHWKNQYAGGALSTLSKAKLTDATGAFWIADSNTYEYLIRIQPGQSNGRSWIAIPTFTDVEFWIDVTDTHTGQSKEYHSEGGNRTLLYDPFFFVFP